MPKDTVSKQDSAPAKKVSPAAQCTSPQVAPGIADGSAEQALISNYAKMNEQARAMISRLVVQYARDFPRDWVTLPADIQDARTDAANPPAQPPVPSKLGGVLRGPMDDALDNIADDSDSIDLSLGLVSDLLRVALNECERVGEDVSYVETVIRAARRYSEDISEANMHLQRSLAILEGRAT